MHIGPLMRPTYAGGNNVDVNWFTLYAHYDGTVHGGFRWLKNTISKVTGTKIIGPFFAANVKLGGSGAY